jgi:hypothetical protein
MTQSDTAGGSHTAGTLIAVYDALPADVVAQLPEDTSTEMVAAASKFYERAAAMPSAGEDPTADMLMRIFDISTWDELADPWETTPKDEIFGRELMIAGGVLHPSEFAGAMPVYAYVTATDPKTGEDVGFACGGLFVLAQLAKAHAEGWFPMLMKLVKATRPTRKGFYPYHFVPVGRG